MKWWFLASNHNVRIVLLAKLDLNRRRIKVEKWKERPQQLRPGAMNTRAATAAGAVEQYPDQEIEIKQADGITNTDPNRLNTGSYGVTSDVPLRLEFADLFCRPPAAGEGDIFFTAQRLQEYAVRVWAEV